MKQRPDSVQAVEFNGQVLCASLKSRYPFAGGREGVVVPPVTEVLNGLEALFWISLTSDEGRPARGNFTFVQPGAAEAITLRDAVSLKETSQLAQLLHATDPVSGALAVANGSVWGILPDAPLTAYSLCLESDGVILLQVAVQCFSDARVWFT